MPFTAADMADSEIVNALQEAGLIYQRLDDHALMIQVANDLACGQNRRLVPGSVGDWSSRSGE